MYQNLLPGIWAAYLRGIDIKSMSRTVPSTIGRPAGKKPERVVGPLMRRLRNGGVVRWSKSIIRIAVFREWTCQKTPTLSGPIQSSESPSPNVCPQILQGIIVIDCVCHGGVVFHVSPLRGVRVLRGLATRRRSSSVT
jgi:hypothetical protein